jgi:hypothetical protein
MDVPFGNLWLHHGESGILRLMNSAILYGKMLMMAVHMLMDVSHIGGRVLACASIMLWSMI